jgi:branched-chain amino acid transport system substrate-binding protein
MRTQIRYGIAEEREKEMDRKAVTGIMLTLLAVSIAFNVVPVHGSTQYIKIGIVGPKGWIQWNGLWEGAQMARDKINNAGGINISGTFYNIQLIDIDEHSVPTPDPASAVAELLTKLNANPDMQFLIGGFRAECVAPMEEAAMNYAASHGRPIWIIAGAAADSLISVVKTNYARYKYMFRVSPWNSTVMVETLANFIAQIAAPKLKALYSIAGNVPTYIIAENLVWADSWVAFFQANCSKYGMDLKGVSRPSSIATDFSADIAAATAAGAKIVVHMFSAVGGASFIKQYGALKPNFTCIGINLESQMQEFYASVGGACEYEAFLASVGTRTPIIPGVTDKFWDDYEAKYGHSSVYTAWGAYDAIMALAEMLGNPALVPMWPMTCDQLIPIIEQTDRTGILGRFKYTGPNGVYHDVFSNELGSTWTQNYVRPLVVQWQAGEMKVVWPTDQLYSGCFILPPWFPLPKYTKFKEYQGEFLDLEHLNQHLAPYFEQNITPDLRREDNWCGPTVAAACLAWFAEANPKKYGSLIPNLNPEGKDEYWDKIRYKYMVAQALGWSYMDTSPNGTEDADLIRGLEHYIDHAGLGNKFTVTPIWNPSYTTFEDEFKKGEDVLVGTRDGNVGHWVVARALNENPNTDGSHNVSFMDPWDGTFTDSHWTPKAGPAYDELDLDLDGNSSTTTKVELIVSVSPVDPPMDSVLNGYVVVSHGVTYVITGTDFDEVYVVNGTVFGVIGGTVYNTTGTVYGFANGTVSIVNGTYFPVMGSAYIINGSRVQNYPSIPLHDVAVADVQPFKPVVGAGFPMSINVTIDNGGNQNETFFVTAYANTTLTQGKTVTLAYGNFKTITFTWNTTGFAYGNYTLSAYAWPVPGEINTANNNFTGGWVEVRLRGLVTLPSPGHTAVSLADFGKLKLIYSQVYPYKCPPFDVNNPETYYYLNSVVTGKPEYLMPDIDGNGKVQFADVGKEKLIYSGMI